MITTIIDWILIILSTMVTIKSVKRLFSNNVRIIDFCLITFYIFNCLPVLLDKIIGVPNYNSWFSGFREATSNEKVAIIYDIYMLLTLIIFMIYIRKTKKSKNQINYSENTINKYFLIILSIIPHIYIVATGQLMNFKNYTSLSQRNLTTTSMELLNLFNQISLVSAFSLYFCKKNVKKSKLLFGIYLLSMCWIDGKRYIVLNIIVMFIFMKMKTDKEQHNIGKNLKMGLLIILLFSIFYTVYSKNKIEGVYSKNSISFYTDFRINFGRDDVIKFVIMKELIYKEPILNYRGESILANFVMFIPRKVWENKPYPHYRYLSAALYNKDILNIPAGMTPSIFDMGIANFYYAGIIITPLIIVMLCSLAEKSKSIMKQAIYTIILLNLLTQSLDAASGFIIAIIISDVYNYLFKRSNKENENM